MKKKAESLIPIAIIIGLVVIIFVITFIIRTTHFNPDNANGNTSSNLTNNGLFAEYNGKIYFANPADNFYLYVMNLDETDKKLLVKDSVKSINVYGSYIFYTRFEANDDISFAFLNVNRFSLCRVDLNGKNKKILDSEPSLNASLIGNYLYYIHYDDKNASTLYKVKIDGKEKQELNKNPYSFSGVKDNLIYYNELEKNHNIMAYDTGNQTSKTILEGNCSNIICHGNYIYYMNNETSYAIYRYNLNDGKTEMIVNHRCDFFAVNDDYIFYQTPGNKPALYRHSLKDGTEELIKEGAFCDLNLTSNFLYFRQYKSNEVYKQPVSGPIETSRF